MFSKILQENIPEGEGESLWEQCLEVLRQVDPDGDTDIDEVNRLAVLASKQVEGDFHSIVEEILSDPINGFLPELPWR